MHAVPAIGSHGHAREAVEPGLRLVAMNDKFVDPLAEGPVALRLHGGRMLVASFVHRSCERLRGNDLVALRVTDRGCLCQAEVRRRSVRRFRPELGHGYVRRGAEIEIGRGVQVIWFELQVKPVLLAAAPQSCGLIFTDQFIGGLTNVPKKAIRNFGCIDHESAECRRKRTGS